MRVQISPPDLRQLRLAGHTAFRRSFYQAYHAASVESARYVGADPCLAASALAEQIYHDQVRDQLNTAVDAGFQAKAGTAMTDPADCGWTFSGYGMPLYDPPSNEAWWRALSPFVDWYPNLGWHVWTTSTSTVYIRDRCEWRLYFPPNQGGPVVPDQGVATLSYPNVHPAYSGGLRRYPSAALWSLSKRFDDSRFSFVPSPDRGRSFPVYAPKITGAGTGIRYDWSDAGWTPTGVTYVPQKVSSAGLNQQGEPLWLRYQDLTVIDLYEEIGWYLMIAIECRWRGPADGSETACCVYSCDGCKAEWDDNGHPGGPEYLAHTRLVMFASRDPDFPSAGLLGAPGDPDRAIVLLQPDTGPDGPDGVCPNERYAVPHAIRMGEGSQAELLIYVPWTGHGEDGTSGLEISAPLPQRVKERYPADPSVYRNSLDYQRPIWRDDYSGLSCFKITDHRVLQEILELWEGGDPGDALWAQAVLNTMVREAYQGEVLITDGATYLPTYPYYAVGATTAVPWQRPTPKSITDPHWVLIDDELWVYWDIHHLQGGLDNKDQVRCAKLVADAAALNAEVLARTGTAVDYTNVLKQNGDYTLFLTPAECEVAFDLRQLCDPSAPLTDGEEYGRLTSDPDIVQLDDGTLRLVCFGGGGSCTAISPPAGDGLLLVLKEPT